MALQHLILQICPAVLTRQRVNCLDLMLTDVPRAVEPMVDLPLGNSDHSSIAFSVKMGIKIPNITFFRKVYLKSRVNWTHVGEDFHNSNWSKVYKRLNTESKSNFFNCVNAFHNKQNAYRLGSKNRSPFL